MNFDKNTIYYFLTASIFLLLKTIYTFTETSDLMFLLKPISFLVSWITNAPAKFSELGCYHQNLNILIDKSCSGFNFWGICFVMLSFLGIKSLNLRQLQVLILAIALIFAYIFTIFVNTSRIVISLVLDHIFPQNWAWFHEAEGAFVYLFFLICLYLGFDYSLKKLAKLS